MGNEILFSVRGEQTTTLHPFDPNLRPSKIEEGWYLDGSSLRPAILSSGNWSYAEYGDTQKDLHWLLFAANSESAKKGINKLTKPLYGHRAGERVKINQLGTELLEVAENASSLKIGESHDLTDSDIFESGADWTYNKAESALIGLTGIEGVLALLRSKRSWRIDKEMLSSRIFFHDGMGGTNSDLYRIISNLNIKEVDLLITGLKEESLKSYHEDIFESYWLKKYPLIQAASKLQ